MTIIKLTPLKDQVATKLLATMQEMSPRHIVRFKEMIAEIRSSDECQKQLLQCNMISDVVAIAMSAHLSSLVLNY